MRILISILTLGLIFANCSVSTAAKTKKSSRAPKATKVVKAKAGKKGTAPKPSGDSLSTDVRFDASTLHGQYQTPDEVLAKVENEKSLQDLIGVRKHFKDRLAVASEQE